MLLIDLASQRQLRGRDDETSNDKSFDLRPEVPRYPFSSGLV